MVTGKRKMRSVKIVWRGKKGKRQIKDRVGPEAATKK